MPERYQVGKWYQTDEPSSIKTGHPSGHGFCWILIRKDHHVIIDTHRISIVSNPELYGSKLTKFNRALSVDETSAVSEEFIKRLFRENLIEI